MRDVLKSPCQCTTHPLLSNSQHYVATPYHCTSTMPRHHEQQQTAYQQRSADQPNDWVTEPVYEELPSGKKMPFPSPPTTHPARVHLSVSYSFQTFLFQMKEKLGRGKNELKRDQKLLNSNIFCGPSQGFCVDDRITAPYASNMFIYLFFPLVKLNLCLLFSCCA